jgi:hypothetical protein
MAAMPIADQMATWVMEVPVLSRLTVDAAASLALLGNIPMPFPLGSTTYLFFSQMKAKVPSSIAKPADMKPHLKAERTTSPESSRTSPSPPQINGPMKAPRLIPM